MPQHVPTVSSHVLTGGLLVPRSASINYVSGVMAVLVAMNTFSKDYCSESFNAFRDHHEAVKGLIERLIGSLKAMTGSVLQMAHSNSSSWLLAVAYDGHVKTRFVTIMGSTSHEKRHGTNSHLDINRRLEAVCSARNA